MEGNTVFVSLPPRFQFTIAPNTPLKDLLPTPPVVKKPAGPALGDDLTQVPEVEFQGIAKKQPAGEDSTRSTDFEIVRVREGRRVDRQVENSTRSTASLIARVNHLNGRGTDGFLVALRGERPDLAGLPFAMGDACRIKGERSRLFTQAVATVRRCLSQPRQTGVGVAGPGGGPGPITGPAPTPAPQSAPTPPAPNPPPAVPPAPNPPHAVVTAEGFLAATSVNEPENFWEQYQAAIAQEDRAGPAGDRAHREAVTLARVAALMQILAPEPPHLRAGLVKYLSGVAHPEATRALARLAVFSPEEEVRRAAIDALQVRRERDYTDVLLRGLRYPWPAVARHAAEAVVKLERADLVPQLVALLDEPDPRAPVTEEVDGKKATVVHEMVRVNHHRSCLLCHSPGNTSAVSPEALTAAVPVPDQPLPLPSEGYRVNSPDVTVRVDVTYLRQDFSARQAVADANPWPEMQRFDFLVRTRVLTDAEAETFRAKLGSASPDRPSPYRRAALVALRELTGRDTEPTAAAWRKLLAPPEQRP
jgi:hypothetical protein